MCKELIPWYIRHHHKPRRYPSTDLAKFLKVSQRMIFYFIHGQREPTQETKELMVKYMGKIHNGKIATVN
jgi:plasmid maintenance system antidote protein VapI